MAEFFRGNTEVLERLAAEMYARGLSTRDIKDSLKETTGDLILSISAVSKVTADMQEDFERFRNQDLSGFEIMPPFLRSVVLGCVISTSRARRNLVSLIAPLLWRCAKDEKRNGKKLFYRLNCAAEGSSYLYTKKRLDIGKVV